MNSMHSASFTAYKVSPVPVPPLVHFSPLTFGFHLKTRLKASHSIALSLTSAIPSRSLRLSTGAAIPSNEGAASVVQFEDFVEKDWSFLDCDSTDDAMQKIDRIISAGNVKETSKVLVSIGTEAFVDRLVDSSPCQQLLVVHDSLFTLACIKEKYDKVGCWQGEVINVPKKWTPIDVVYLYFLPGLPLPLDQLLAALAKNCLPGARVVISHTKGRQAVEEQRQQHPDVVVSNFPDKITLQSIVAGHAFQVAEYVDEPGFFLAVLRLGEE